MTTSDKMDPDELRDELLRGIRDRVNYWAALPDFDAAIGRTYTVWDRCDGVAFSILAMLDGISDLPAFDLTAHVHPEDEDQSMEGVTISDMLHEHYSSIGREATDADH